MNPVLTNIIAIILTAGVTYYFTALHFRKQKRYEFSQRRLDELYAPFYGYSKKIRVNAKFRVKASKASEKTWREICKSNPQPSIDHDKDFEPYKRQIEDENKRFNEEDIPAYDAMLDLLKTKNQFAYHSTLKWFDQFAEFVAHLHRRLPAKTLKELDISEEPLFDFYSEVKERYNQLKLKLSGDKKE
ncbi:hypothetical protein KAH81_05265 [bacterium]|nr:hypothetical protein [bacterium]